MHVCGTMEDFEQVTEEEQWLEVRQKKTTPNKKPSASKADNDRREKRGEYSKRPNNTTDTKRDGKKRDGAKTKGAAGPAPKATVSTPVATPQKAVLSAPPKTPSSAVATEGSTAPLGLQNEETPAPAAPTVTDSGVKRGYSSIVSALAAKLPPELPPTGTVLDDAPLSVFEFCMRCQDASTLGTPVASPLVTRGLVNPKSDCFQNCVLQALFALPHFRRLLYSFRDCRRLDEHLPLWSEMLRFAGQFLVNPVELDNPSLSEASSGGKARRGASVASSARYKDCVLASEAMPRLCASFDTLVHREGHRVSDEGGDGLTQSTGGTLRLAEAFDQLQLSSTEDSASATTVTAVKPPLSLAETLKQSTNASSSSVAPATRRTKAASAAGNNNSQQDAMEFLTFVLDALHEELNCAAAALLTPDERSLLTVVIQSLPAYQQTSEQLAQATMTAAGATDEWATVRRSQPPAVKQVTVDAASKGQALRDLFAPSIIPRLCHGLLRSEVVYKTKKMCSITFQKFHCLTLNLRAPSPGNGRVTVRDALVNYFAEEVRARRVGD